MTLFVLDGNLNSTYIPLKKDYIFSQKIFNDPKISDSHAQIQIDHNNDWKINSLGKNKIRLKTEETTSISLFPGLIFSLGNTSFKVVNRLLPSSNSWDSISADFIDKVNIKSFFSPDFFFFLVPLQITFLQGLQSGEILTVSYGPRILGYNQLDLNINDSTLPHELLKFTQNGDQTIITNLTNGVLFYLKESIKFTFGTNIIEISPLT